MIRLETLALICLSINLYGRSVWIALVGHTLNPGVMIVSAPFALIAYLWLVQKVESDIESKQEANYVDDEHQLSTESQWGLLDLVGPTLFCLGAWVSWQAYTDLILAKTSNHALWWREVGFILEGLGVIGLWRSWTWQAYGQDRALAWRLHYPLSILIFALPWEGLLRGFDLELQGISTDLGIFCLDLLNLLYEWERPLVVNYWDSITLYSDHFYLIINETCAGVNLLISMSLYAVGFGWVMKGDIKRAWLLVAYIIPLCMVFNGLRIAMIFCLGHFGDQALATGGWHEGSAYICQICLFILMALINRDLDRVPVSSRHGPLG